ncbi:MAG: hydroxyacylglutathione hydrolase [Cocleimonas sp.]|nr:hydroxyacylglutathione hydrolase [Cocleimonas sp.]
MSTVLTVPAFSDNYIWLLCDDRQKYAVIIDPGDAQPVLKQLVKYKIEPLALLITHHHHDHVGGIAALLQKYPHIPVYGPKNEQIPHCTHALVEGDRIHLEKIGITLSVLDTAGHTAGHIVYYGDKKLFCGDTLFVSGCGRVFDGTLHDLYQSLEKIAKLPPDTQIYCAHEYTLDNIGFAKWVEEDNMDLIAHEKRCQALIDNDKATVPSLLSNELKTNPFLRCHEPTVIEKAERFMGKPLTMPSEVFSAIRQWKDSKYD